MLRRLVREASGADHSGKAASRREERPFRRGPRWFSSPPSSGSVYGLLTMRRDDSRQSEWSFRPCCRRWSTIEMPMSNEGNPDQKVTAARLGPETREHIAAHLQSIFAGIEGEPITNEQVDLL